MKKDSLVKIGYVLKTHGLKGAVTLRLNPDAPEIKTGAAILIEVDTGHVPYFIEMITHRNDQAFLKLEDVNTIEQSKQLKGRSIFIEKSKRPKLTRGEYYDDELIGLTVFEGKKALGIVNQIINQGPARFIEVGPGKLLIPINGPFIKSISTRNKRMEVELPDGFLDI